MFGKRSQAKQRYSGEGGTQVQVEHADAMWVDPVFHIGKSEPLTEETIQRIRRHALAAAGHAVDSQLNRFTEPFGNVELTALFDCFLDYTWLGACEEAVDRLQAVGYQDPAFPGLFVDWMQDEWTGTYESVSLKLRGGAFNDVEHFLRRRLREAEQRGESPDSDSMAPIRQGLKNIAFLNQQGTRPKFGVCLPILGHWGAGKSRALVDLADRARQRDNWVIFLKGPELDPPMEYLCRCLAEALGLKHTAGRTPEDIARRLAALGHPDLLVVIDDVDEAAKRSATALDDVQTLMARTATTGTIRWAFTADAASLDLIEASIARSVSNSRYSYASSGLPENISGWLPLDEINERQSVGRNILRQNSSPEVKVQLDQAVHDTELNGRHIAILNRPTFAWLFLETMQSTGSNLFGLSSDEFVDRYINRLYASLETVPATTEELRLSIRLIAEMFTQAGSAAEFDISDLRMLFSGRGERFIATFYEKLLPLLREGG